MAKPSNEDRARWHADQTNWKWGVFYFNKKDPRIWLPKKNPWFGWTVNFSHPGAWLWILVLLALALLPVLVPSWCSR